jgi:hypothetical protein
MIYVVWPTYDDAELCLMEINETMGYPKYPVNAATGEIDYTAQPTTTWSDIMNFVPGKYFLVPPPYPNDYPTEDWEPEAIP